MKLNDDFMHNQGQNNEQRSYPNILTSATHSIAIYTVLTILLKMKKQLGLEAMLQYIDKYLKTITDNNPNLAHAVARAISLMSVEKMYKDAMDEHSDHLS